MADIFNEKNETPAKELIGGCSLWDHPVMSKKKTADFE